jgi:hypothetical protein
MCWAFTPCLEIEKLTRQVPAAAEARGAEIELVPGGSGVFEEFLETLDRQGRD